MFAIKRAKGRWKISAREFGNTCHIYFDNKEPKPLSSFLHIQCALKEYMQLKEKACSYHAIVILRQEKGWVPSPTNSLKVDMDRSFDNETDNAVYGVLIRDTNGTVVNGVGNSCEANCALISEAKVLMEGIILSRDLSLSKILVDTDSLEICNAFQKKDNAN